MIIRSQSKTILLDTNRSIRCHRIGKRIKRMNKEELQKFQKLIDRVYVACNTKAILLTSNEEIAKRLREGFPGIETKVISNPSVNLMNTNTVYIIPTEERSIKVIYEGGINENQ